MTHSFVLQKHYRSKKYKIFTRERERGGCDSVTCKLPVEKMKHVAGKC